MTLQLMPAICEWPCGKLMGQVLRAAPVMALRRMPLKQAAAGKAIVHQLAVA